MQHLFHHLNKRLSHLTYGKASTMRNNPVVTRNRVVPLSGMNVMVH